MTGTRRFVVLGGGDPTTGNLTTPNQVLSEELLYLGLRPLGPHLHVVVVPTAKATQETYDKLRAWAAKFFDLRGISWEMLHPFGEPGDPSNMQAALNRATHLLVAGGNTDAMLSFWRRHGLIVWDEQQQAWGGPLIEAIGRTTTFGWSAALAFAFTNYLTDSASYRVSESQAWDYHLSPGLGLFEGWVTPHSDDSALQYTRNSFYAPDTTRRDIFAALLSVHFESRPSGIAVDNLTALVIEDDMVTVFGSGRVTLHVWQGSRLVERDYHNGEQFSLSHLSS
ncbi:MAG TPA: Type 1 glutamine amidotransferase-like domain-containing protein [Candidatus Saccharimonadia bacterium]|jgi:peptidase E|nr:Type 1 glutamine amidotransferase-like domain-containing protein [Candidatus Saccharimonadia bacterium]